MEKTALNGSTEKIKENIYAVSKQSKETIRGIINASSSQVENALDVNKKFMQSIEKQYLSHEFIGNNLAGDLNKTFSDSVELSEESIDTIIDMQSAQLQSAIEMNLKLVNTIKDIDFNNREDRDALVKIIEKSFDESSKQLIENTKKMTDLYNKHINLALNFNEKFSRDIDKRLQSINVFQTKNMDMFTDWANHWWKSSTKEEASV